MGGAAVIKQDSEYYEHFYHQLEPYKHYIPLSHDLNDVVDLVQWAIDNDETVLCGCVFLSVASTLMKLFLTGKGNRQSWSIICKRKFIA